jgi:hypothetical protein
MYWGTRLAHGEAHSHTLSRQSNARPAHGFFRRRLSNGFAAIPLLIWRWSLVSYCASSIESRHSFYSEPVTCLYAAHDHILRGRLFYE